MDGHMIWEKQPIRLSVGRDMGAEENKRIQMCLGVISLNKGEMGVINKNKGTFSQRESVLRDGNKY